MSPERGHVVQVIPAAGVHCGPGAEVTISHSVGHISLPPVSAELKGGFVKITFTIRYSRMFKKL